MSWAWTTATFLLVLPLAVWLLAAAASILDVRHDRLALLHACLRLAFGIVAVLVIALLTHPGLVIITGTALITVTALHVAWFYALRKLFIGVPSYTLAPADPPLLVAEPDETDPHTADSGEASTDEADAMENRNTDEDR